MAGAVIQIRARMSTFFNQSTHSSDEPFFGSTNFQDRPGESSGAEVRAAFAGPSPGLKGVRPATHRRCLHGAQRRNPADRGFDDSGVAHLRVRCAVARARPGAPERVRKYSLKCRENTQAESVNPSARRASARCAPLISDSSRIGLRRKIGPWWTAVETGSWASCEPPRSV